MKTKNTIKLVLLGISLIMLFQQRVLSQTVTALAPGDYKHITINTQGNSDYTRALILLHEMYNGTNLVNNHAIGTITARRGGAAAINRIAVAEINSSSAYQSTQVEFSSMTDGTVAWKLRSCMYNGKRYLALELPYQPARFDLGYKFSGWTTSSGENMLFVPYEVNGQPVNQNLISDIQDYSPTMQYTKIAKSTNFIGNVGIGTNNPTERLSVNGTIRAKEVKVDSGWADYVFDDNYEMKSLAEVEAFIKENKHLPGIPSEAEVNENGVELGEMNRKLLEKVEELTLHVIRQQKEIDMLRQKPTEKEPIKKSLN